MKERCMKTSILFGLLVLSASLSGGCAGSAISPTASMAAAGVDRTVLPIVEPTHPPITEMDARKAKAPPRFEVKPPTGAPNVVIVLIDDIGFGHSSAFGGPIRMPTLERLAAE